MAADVDYLRAGKEVVSEGGLSQLGATAKITGNLYVFWMILKVFDKV